MIIYLKESLNHILCRRGYAKVPRLSRLFDRFGFYNRPKVAIWVIHFIATQYQYDNDLKNETMKNVSIMFRDWNNIIELTLS